MRPKNRSIANHAALGAIVVVATLTPVTARAQDASDAGRSKEEHVVRKGDTLWDIAAKYLNDPFKWPVIYEANRDVVENAHWIYPKERLIIPGVGVLYPDGTLVPDATAAGPDRSRFYYGPATPTPAATRGDRPTVLTDLDRSMVSASLFQAAPWLQERQTLPVRGEVRRVVDPDGEDETLDRTSFPFERLYIAYRGDLRPAVGDRLLVVEPAGLMDGYGDVIEPAAIVEVVSMSEDVFTARAVQQFGAVEPGALAIPLPATPAIAGQLPAPVEGGRTGSVIALHGAHELPGAREAVFLDLGASQGVKVGDELVATIPAREDPKAAGVTLPPEPVARLRVLRVMSGSSTAQIVNLYNASLEPGTPVRVVATLR